MARIEKTVFISYRRTDVYTALAVYENLKNQGYDVFFDYRSISSGDFEQIITSNIRARAHFLLILTPTALDRCNEPDDWLRREIEMAIDERRNIIPLFFKGFRFGAPSVAEKMTGKLKNLSRYNGLNVHEDYFDEAMHRLRIQYLNIPLNTVLHPVSTEVQKVVRAEQVAADKALEQIEDVQELVKQADEKPVQLEVLDPMPGSETSAFAATPLEMQSETSSAVVVEDSIQHKEIQTKSDEIQKKKDTDLKTVPKKEKTKVTFPFSLPAKIKTISNLNYRFVGGVGGGLFLLFLLIWGGVYLFRNQFAAATNPTPTSQVSATQAPEHMETNTPPPIRTDTPSPTKTSIPPTPTPGIGSTLISDRDGMTLLYVPAGDFTMGGDIQETEKPVHKVTLDAFWIDQTEVTNKMYTVCVTAGSCTLPTSTTFYADQIYANHPVVYVSWYQAVDYCSWAGRHLATEAEWEKASRGTDGRTYPWGNNGPNSSLLNHNKYTMEVGKYPNGESPYGALDLAGNVWEWTSSLFRPYPYVASDGREDLTASGGRVLRGGSTYSYGAYPVYSAVRFSNQPSNTYYLIGFRCAMSATP